MKAFDNKRHVLTVTIGDRDVTIGTDSIEEVAKYLDPYYLPKAAEEKPQQSRSNEEKLERLEQDQQTLNANMNKIVDFVTELRDVVKEMQESKQQPRREQQEEQEPRQPQPQSQPQQHAQEQAQTVQEPPSSFLDISPNAMQRSQWDTLTEEQRQQWLKHWNLA